jgi:hypothetical protein
MALARDTSFRALHVYLTSRLYPGIPVASLSQGADALLVVSRASMRSRAESRPSVVVFTFADTLCRPEESVSTLESFISAPASLSLAMESESLRLETTLACEARVDSSWLTLGSSSLEASGGGQKVERGEER